MNTNTVCVYQRSQTVPGSRRVNFGDQSAAEAGRKSAVCKAFNQDLISWFLNSWINEGHDSSCCEREAEQLPVVIVQSAVRTPRC